ncbi:MAG: outer membrane beta-barrel protein [Alphaproteobacteria bacterium]|nr:outer membrane beta-barrel protein [Alphaproteobacteria bacterium]MBV9693943.1 outer membrane beta-barrel protein [Alphaproteobacteria bacterium]
MKLRTCLIAASLVVGGSSSAFADALPFPAMNASLSANPNPYGVDLDWAGKWFVGAAVTGLVFDQDNPGSGAHSLVDLDNAQAWIEKTDGWWQVYVQAGIYTQPSLGFGYIRGSRATTMLYGDVPFAYLKIAPTDNFSISAGKLPTLIGAENAFTYQNLDIQRGLLWNQTPSVTQGVQLNYTAGPLSFALSVNDGYYSQTLNDLSGSVAYAFDGGADTVSVIAGTNLGHNPLTLPFATPLLNDGTIADLVYTHASGPWTISPSLQFVSAPRDPLHGALQGASSIGAMLTANYAFDDHWKLAARAEYVNSTGSAAAGAMNLLIAGPGSKAWSITVTPTYQYNVFFARLEGSYVGASDVTPGFGYGPSANDTTQASVFFETGVLF